MSIKTQAFIRTIGVLAAIGIGSFAIPILLSLIPPVYFTTIFVALLVAVFSYILYGIILGQLEYEEKLKEIARKN